MDFVKNLFSGGSKGVGFVRALGLGMLFLIVDGSVDLPFADNINMLIIGTLAALIGFIRSSTSEEDKQ